MSYAVVEMIDNDGPELCSVWVRPSKRGAMRLAHRMLVEQSTPSWTSQDFLDAYKRLVENGAIALGTWAVAIKKVEDK